MYIKIISLQNRRVPVTRTFEATDLIHTQVPASCPHLRAGPFFAEVRKVLLFCNLDTTLDAPWDEEKLYDLELRADPMAIEASFPHRWSTAQTLCADVAVKAIDEAIAQGLKELKFYVNWFPSTMTYKTLVAIAEAEESLFRSWEPVQDFLSSQKQRTAHLMHKLSHQLALDPKRTMAVTGLKEKVIRVSQRETTGLWPGS